MIYAAIAYTSKVTLVLEFINPEWLKEAYKMSKNQLRRALKDEKNFVLLSFYQA